MYNTLVDEHGSLALKTDRYCIEMDLQLEMAP